MRAVAANPGELHGKNVTGENIEQAVGRENAIVVQLGSGRIMNPDTAKRNRLRALLQTHSDADIAQAWETLVAGGDPELLRIATPVFDELREKAARRAS